MICTTIVTAIVIYTLVTGDGKRCTIDGKGTKAKRPILEFSNFELNFQQWKHLFQALILFIDRLLS